MVQAWYMNGDSVSPNFANHTKPPRYLNLNEVRKVTGVDCYQLELATIKPDDLTKIMSKRLNYTIEDEIICSRQSMPDFEEKVRAFYQEHLHEDDEVRLVVGGSGYFDVRDKNDAWIRIHVFEGDMIILPGGIYHRFALDEKVFIHLKRYFKCEKGWMQYKRPAEEMECRKMYVERMGCEPTVVKNMTFTN